MQVPARRKRLQELTSPPFASFDSPAVSPDGRHVAANVVSWGSGIGRTKVWGLGKEGFVNPAFRRFNENLVRTLSARK